MPAPKVPVLKLRVARFYKIDHGGDPVLLPNGHIRLGVQKCKAQLRAGIRDADFERGDNVIVAIGGITAKDGLRDRLAWVGVPIEKRSNGCVDCDRGFFLMGDGPLEWRDAFPVLAEWVDTVTEGHRVGRLERLPGERKTKTSAAIAAELVRLYHWGMKRAHGAATPKEGRTGPPCPPSTGSCPTASKGPSKRRWC